MVLCLISIAVKKTAGTKKPTIRSVFSGFWCPEGDSKYSNKAMILLVFSLVWFCLLTNLLTNLLTYGAAGGAGSDESSAAHTVNSRYFMPVFEEM